MPALFRNNATATLAASIITTDTTIVVSAGLGTLFPSPTGTSYFYATLFDSVGNYEIVKVTARATDTFTVVRGQDGTIAKNFSSGDGIALRPVAAVFNNLVQLDGDQTIAGIKTFTSNIVANLTGNVTGNVTGNLTGNATTATSANSAAALNSLNFSIVETAGVLQFKYGSTVVMSMDQSGNLISSANITAYGTP